MDSDRAHGASCTGTSGSSGAQSNASQDALVIVGQSTLEQAVDKSRKHVAREPGTSPEDIDKAIQEAASQVS